MQEEISSNWDRFQNLDPMLESGPPEIYSCLLHLLQGLFYHRLIDMIYIYDIYVSFLVHLIILSCFLILFFLAFFSKTSLPPDDHTEDHFQAWNTPTGIDTTSPFVSNFVKVDFWLNYPWISGELFGIHNVLLVKLFETIQHTVNGCLCLCKSYV